jgi:outer membrane lipoprotein-sorting protein
VASEGQLPVSFLRRISTRHLILLCASVVALGAACTAIALAATSGGPTPPPKPLDVAVHDALTASQPQGVTATIDFKNRLIDSADFEGTDPLLFGGSGRLWATPDGHLRIEVQSTSGDAQLVSDGKSWWAYDPSSNTVYRGAVPQHRDGEHQVPTLQKIQDAIARLQGHANVSGAQPDNVGGQQAYDVRVSPKESGGLLGGASLAWDAVNGVPLRVGLYAKGESDPVLELTVKDISYGSVASDAVDISPPSGARTVDLTGSKDHANTTDKSLSFTPVAPDSLAGLDKNETKPLGHDSVLITYGEGPGAIAVIEKKAEAAAAVTPQSGDHHHGLNLPTASINGATGQELSTPLGTAITFERDGISYTVLGSVPSDTALAAARGL